MSRNLPNIHRGLIAGGFITTAPIIVAFAALTMAAPAFAQSSLDSPSAPATDYAPPDGGPLVEPAMPGEATPDDAIPNDDATPSDAIPSAAVTTEPSAAVKPATAAGNGSTSAAAHSGCDRVGDVDSDSEDQADQVLEVPQVLSGPRLLRRSGREGRTRPSLATEASTPHSASLTVSERCGFTRNGANSSSLTYRNELR
jgi:hypothetical protein